MQTLKLPANVLVRGFKADIVPTFQDKLSRRKARQGEIYRCAVHNLVVNVGLDLIGSRLRSNTDNFIDHNGVGSSSQAVASGDTDLISAIGSRKAVTSAYAGATGVTNWDTFYLAGDNNGTWREVALFNASAAGKMLARAVITAFTKTGPGAGANTASVDWTATVTNAP